MTVMLTVRVHSPLPAHDPDADCACTQPFTCSRCWCWLPVCTPVHGRNAACVHSSLLVHCRNADCPCAHLFMVVMLTARVHIPLPVDGRDADCPCTHLVMVVLTGHVKTPLPVHGRNANCSCSDLLMVVMLTACVMLTAWLTCWWSWCWLPVWWYIVQELCESRGGRPGLSVLTNLLVFVDVKNYWAVLRHWSQLVPNMSTDIWGHYASIHHHRLCVADRLTYLFMVVMLTACVMLTTWLTCSWSWCWLPVWCWQSPLPVQGGVAARDGQRFLQRPLRVVELLVGEGVHVAGGVVGSVEVQPAPWLPGWGQLVGRSSVRPRHVSSGCKGIEPD